jgi:hypothetical protein
MAISFNANTYKVMIDNFSKSLTYTPVTKTTDNITGDETLTSGTPSTISAAFFKRDQIYNQEYVGLIKDADAIMVMLPTVNVTKNSFITYGGEKYQIRDDLFERKLGTVHFYNVARLYLYG